jgi:hypothetical protein
MFKGTTPIGKPVTVKLELDSNAAGSAVVAVAWSGGGQTGGHDECAAAPGGFCTAKVTPTEKGLLRVVVDMKIDDDKGTLSVTPPTPAEEIQGDNSWLYTVE